jgi:putative transposase
MNAALPLSQVVGVQPACSALGLPRASYYRHLRPAQNKYQRPSPPLKLSTDEREQVHQTLCSERFVDQAPASIVATLLDEGVYLCAERTMYRILAEHNQLKERRRGHQHRAYTKPELLATAPNQVWSWDITKLKGPQTWSYFYLYVIIDIFSRYVVGWMIADREAAILARTLIEQTCNKQGIASDQLILHADRGPSMKSKLVAHLLADLGITKTHSRPYTSDDNPYSEAHFKTLKYRPDFPERFGAIQDAKSYCQTFFHWYNTIHKHSGIAMLTPQAVHYQQAAQVLDNRQLTLTKAFAQHPARFKNLLPTVEQLPTAAWINQPSSNKPEECKISH